MAYDSTLVNARGKMPAPLIKAGNQAVATPTLTSNQQSLANNQNILAGQAGSPWSVSVDQLKPVQPINLPPDISTVNPDATIAGVMSTVGDIQNTITSLTPAETPLDQTQNSLINRINELLPQAGGQAQALAQEQQNQGLPNLQKQLQDINNQINIGNAEYSKLDANYQNSLANAEGTARSAFDYAGSTGALQRQYLAEKAVKAADLGMKSAQAQAVSGNINSAIALAKSAVDAKFAPIEDELKIRQAQLEAIAPLLSKQEKQQAATQKAQIDERQQQVKDQKDTANKIQDIMIEAAKNGATPDVLSKIQNAQTPGEAIYYSGGLGAKADTQVVEVNGHKVLINAQTGTTIKDLGRSSSGSSGSSSGITVNSDSGFNAKQLTRIKQIIASNPDNPSTGTGWGTAADQINAEFKNPNAATQADGLLKAAFQLPSDAVDLARNTPNNLTADQWLMAREQFINDHPYDTKNAATLYDKFVKKPTKTGSGVLNLDDTQMKDLVAGALTKQ